VANHFGAKVIAGTEGHIKPFLRFVKSVKGQGPIGCEPLVGLVGSKRFRRQMPSSIQRNLGVDESDEELWFVQGNKNYSTKGQYLVPVETLSPPTLQCHITRPEQAQKTTE